MAQDARADGRGATQAARRRAWGEPVLLVAVLGLDLLVFSSLFGGRAPATGWDRALIPGYAVVGVALLALRRRTPVGVFCAVLAHSLLARILVPAYHPTSTLLVALAAVAAARSSVLSVPALLVALVPSGFAVQEAVETTPDPRLRAGAAAVSSVGYLLVTGAAWGAGRWSRRQRHRLRDVEGRMMADLAEQRAAADRALAEERLRIARELHDIVAHAVTVMTLHAAGARRLVIAGADGVEQSLAVIESSGQQAIAELRRLLGLLRAAGAASAEERPAGLARLDELLVAVRTGGVEVRVQTTGTPVPLDASVDLAAFRVVQESLTNVVKHAGPGSTATVQLDWSPDRLDIRIDDDAAGHTGAGAGLSSGHGLLGLRERVTVVQGQLTAGRSESGGYTVLARLPIRGAAGGLPDRRTPSEDSSRRTALR